MTDDHSEGDHEEEHGHHEEDRPDYDPRNVDLPEKEPPLRTTAPQSDFTMSQVFTGGAVALVGLLLTFGIAFLLV